MAPSAQARWDAKTLPARREKYAPRGECEFCGADEDLVWDHVDPATKEFNVMSRLLYSEERIKAEIAKCRVLCRSCNSAGKRNGRYIDGRHIGRTARYRKTVA